MPCPACGGAISENKNSKGMVNFKCKDEFKKGCKANGYLRHEGKQKTETGATEGEPRLETPPVITKPPAPEPTPAPAAPEPKPQPARKRRERKPNVKQPATPARRTFDFD